MKYLTGLAAAAERAGTTIHNYSPVLRSEAAGKGIKLVCNDGHVLAEQVIVATNGYSSEDFPDWLGGRYMPVQCNVLMTRPLSDSEIDQQGWSSQQMSFDVPLVS
ncbi:FAD-dependent oxidoreductase [Roseobacter fucihabitans]|nr:FAD-dependent oxidoreductase [Roseobacter litoralis]